MKRLLLFSLFLLMTAAAWGQGSTGPYYMTSATSQCAQIDVTGTLSTVGISVTGTWTGTLQPSVAFNNGTPQVNIPVFPIGSTTSQATITVNGMYISLPAGSNTFYLCPTGGWTGQATVNLNSSTGLAFNIFSVGGALAFSSISSGTNTTAAMVVGSGATLSTSGTGTINATSVNSATSGTVNATLLATATNCNVNSASPAACVAAPAGVIVVPTTTATYTINTTAVTANSRIFIQQITDNSGITGAPTCTAPLVTSLAVPSARVANTSFTFTLPSTAGTTCFNYWIVN